MKMLDVKCKKCSSNLFLTKFKNIYCKKCNERVIIDSNMRFNMISMNKRAILTSEAIKKDRDKELPIKFPHIFAKE